MKSSGKDQAFHWIWILLALDGILFVICILMGAVNIPLMELSAVLRGSGNVKYGTILVHVRLPRTAACALAGSGLALAGAVIQCVLQNPLAGPNIIGVNAGAGLAVVLCSAFFPLSFAVVPLAAFVGAFVAMLFLFLLARRTEASRLTLILAGVCVNSLLNAASDAVHIFYEDTLTGTYGFRLGGFSAVDVRVLIPAGIWILAAAGVVLLFEKELEILSMGEAAALSVGLDIRKTQFLFLALAASLAGACVSISGLLGFVGLIAPHIARRIVGEECRFMLPFCALSGAFLVMLCDLLARTLWAPNEIPTGIILSFVGAPFFLQLLFRQRRRQRHDPV